MVEKYTRLEPRNPKGQPGPGRWTSADGSSTARTDDVSAAQGRSIVANAKRWEGTQYAPVNTHNAGSGARVGVAADCSGSVWAIYGQAGLPYRYTETGRFAAGAGSGAIPFRQLDPGEAPQLGDVVLYRGHMSIYDSKDSRTGQDMVWSAHKAGISFRRGRIGDFGSHTIYRYNAPARGT